MDGSKKSECEDNSSCTFCTTPPSAGWKPRALQISILILMWIALYLFNALFLQDVNAAMISGFFICLFNVKIGEWATDLFKSKQELKNRF